MYLTVLFLDGVALGHGSFTTLLSLAPTFYLNETAPALHKQRVGEVGLMGKKRIARSERDSLNLYTQVDSDSSHRQHEDITILTRPSKHIRHHPAVASNLMMEAKSICWSNSALAIETTDKRTRGIANC